MSPMALETRYSWTTRVSSPATQAQQGALLELPLPPPRQPIYATRAAPPTKREQPSPSAGVLLAKRDSFTEKARDR